MLKCGVDVYAINAAWTETGTARNTIPLPEYPSFREEFVQEQNVENGFTICYNLVTADEGALCRVSCKWAIALISPPFPESVRFMIPFPKSKVSVIHGHGVPSCRNDHREEGCAVKYMVKMILPLFCLLFFCGCTEAPKEQIPQTGNEASENETSQMEPIDVEKLVFLKTYEQSYGEKTKTDRSGEGSSHVVDKISQYQDTEGNVYQFNSRGDFINYKCGNMSEVIENNSSQPSVLNVEDYCANHPLILSLIPNYSEYEVDSVSSMQFGIGYDLVLLREVRPGIDDQALISVANDGTIISAALRLTYLDDFTENQKAELDAQFSDYMEERSETYHSYELSDAVYRVIGDEIVGTYYYILQGTSPGDINGGELGASAMFTLPLPQKEESPTDP